MRRPIRGVYLLAVGVALGVSAAPAQLPTKFTNLRVLPKGISQGELLDTMRGFTSGLGVRCSHCHVHSGSNPDDLSTFDFASDDKEHKRAARVMMQMVRAINQEHLPRLGEEPAELGRVSCVTCHHGMPEPATLDDELTEALAAGGVEAAKRRYQELRAEYYGRSVYDFGPESLVRLGRRLAREGKLAEAIALLTLNLEHHPRSASTLGALGEAQAQHGDRAGAVATLTRLLELEPDNAWAKKQLEELRQPPPS